MGDEETYEPEFTIHGFRYASIEGRTDVVDMDSIEAVVCHSDMPATGTFECSDERLNQLHENVRWSMRGNFVDVPTDCPQRDERLGWTGDIQVFAPTAAFLYDCCGLLESWLADLAVEQAEFGTVPAYVPWIDLLFPVAPAAAWGDAAVVVPWVLYERFGDLEVLRRQYDSMRAWVDQIATLTGDDHIWSEGFQFGDWLDPAAPPREPGAARTDATLVATAYHAYTARLVASAAEVLGHDDDRRRYDDLADEVCASFNAEFVTPTGRMASDAQTAYALALRFDLLPTDAQRARAASRLAELVRREDYCIGTGFVGTPLVCDALVDAGFVDDAYHLLLQTKCPSWLYPITMGATTVWERWDSLLPDGEINRTEMTSFNHYALGAIADFLHRVVAGLAPAEPGYRKLLVRPRPGGGLTRAAATLRTPYGDAGVRWTRPADRLVVDIVVPIGATARVELPGTDVVDVGPGTHQFDVQHRAAELDPPRPPRPEFLLPELDDDGGARDVLRSATTGIKDVADRAGVSAGTVSNVLNRPERVSEATSAKVWQAIAELGFIRNEFGRQLRAGQSRTIAYLGLAVTNPYFTDVSRGIEDVARRHGLALFLCNSDGDPSREEYYLDMLVEQRVRGVLVSPFNPVTPHLERLRQRGIAVVLVSATAGPEWCSVAVDDVEGGELAIEHLLEQGHRRIAFVGGVMYAVCVADRLLGARKAVAAAGSDPDSLTVLETARLNIAEGRRAGEQLLALPRRRRPTAAFCANDLVALGLLQHLTQRGVSVPGEIAIVGYDDIEFAGAAAVPLTSVRQPRHDLGTTAANLLLAESEATDGHVHQQITIRPQLIVRTSTDRVIGRGRRAIPRPISGQP